VGSVSINTRIMKGGQTSSLLPKTAVEWVLSTRDPFAYVQVVVEGDQWVKQ